MADVWLLAGYTAFFGSISAMLGLTYVAFTRMDRDVRRARMFIMDHRIGRFLGAFTVGFIAVTAAIVVQFGAGSIPPAVASAVLLLWLGAMGYGTYELFMVVRPSKGTLSRLRREFATRARSTRTPDSAATDRSRSETDATK